MKRICYQNRFKINSEINIIPLLDVLMVLLLICMATAPIITQGIEVNLPEITTHKKVENNDENPAVIIQVFGIGKYSISSEKNHFKKLSLDQITLEVKRYLNTNSKTVFFIAGEKEVPYEEIIKALNLLHNAGVKSVSLMIHHL